MRYAKVTILHQPDAGQHASYSFSYQEPLGQTDLETAQHFAFKALGEGKFHKGFVRVVFPQAATYSFRFERTGLMGYNLTQTQEQHFPKVTSRLTSAVVASAPVARSPSRQPDHSAPIVRLLLRW